MRKIYLNLKSSLLVLAGVFGLSNASAQAPIVMNYTFTGATQSFVIPPCVGQVTLQVWGAQGGGVELSGNTSSGNGGRGGYSYGTITGTAGNTLYITTGGFGQSSTNGPAAGGFNGGGGGYASSAGEPGNGGGGATDIRLNGTALSNRIIVAGGGGGGGEDAGDPYGHGGGASGVGYAGYDATQTAAGPGVGSGLGQGANTNMGDGGGGGGGYYGGGSIDGFGSIGADTQGGGGGSGYIGGVTGGSTIDGNSNMPNPAGGNQTGNSGNGYARISYSFNGPGVTVSSASTSICNGASTDLVGNSVVTYTWLPVGAFAGSNSQTVTVTPATSTTYTLQGTNSIGCVSTTMIAVTVFQSVPTLTITNSTSSNSLGVCPGRTALLTAAGAVTYSWTGPTAVTNGVSFTPPSPSSTPDYTIRGENACGISSAVTSISIHPLPSVNPSASSSTLCSGNSLSLTATGNATNYAWSGGSAPSGNGVGFQPPPSTVTYTVIGTSVHGCTAQATTPVTVHPTPLQLPVATPAQLCLGGSSTLTAAGATSYTWASSTQTVNTTAFVVTPATAGAITYTVTKANVTCSDTRVITVTVNPLPSIFAMANPAQVCALQPSTLSIGGGNSYTWTAPGTPNNYTFTGVSPVVYPPMPVTYSVAASDANNCINTTTVSIAVDANPVITIAGGSPSLCVGQQLTMTASGGINYTWTAGSSTFNTAQITVSPTVATQYNVSANNAAGCVAGTNQVVIVYPSPIITAVSSKQSVCSGGAANLTASGANTYTWSANANSVNTNTVAVNPSSPVSAAIIYTVSGRDGNVGCESSQTVQVNVYVPVLSVTGVTSTCVGGLITVNATGGNMNSYSWNTGNGIFYSAGISTNINASTIFTVSALSTSANITCLATKTVAVNTLATPNIGASSQKTVVCKGETVELYGSGGAIYSWNNSMNGPTITVTPLYPTNNYVVTGTDGNGCVGNATVQVKMSTCLGINELNSVSGLVIYPNPNNGEFSIDTDTDVNLTLTNELGQAIKTIYVQGGSEHKVTVSDLSKGIYFLYGQKDNVQIRQKVVVIR